MYYDILYSSFFLHVRLLYVAIEDQSMNQCGTCVSVLLVVGTLIGIYIRKHRWLGIA